MTSVWIRHSFKVYRKSASVWLTLAFLIAGSLVGTPRAWAQSVETSQTKCSTILGARNEAVEQLGLNLGRASTVIFYQSSFYITADGSYERHPSVRKPIGATTFLAGKSYVVNALYDRIYIGEDFVNKSGGTGGTHMKLKVDSDAHAVESGFGSLVSRLYSGGSIQVQADGSVDVSGYHAGLPSAETALVIAKAIKTASSETRVRWTANRLAEGVFREYEP